MRRLPIPLLLALSLAHGQEFEVVSIKPNNSLSGNHSTHTDRGMFIATNISVRRLVLRAYGIKDYQLDGPAWMDSTYFDVSAKFGVALPKDPEKSTVVFQAMMRKMLEERFQLAIHRGERSMGVYALEIGKSGIKFHEAPPGESSSDSSGNTHYKATSISMDSFAGFLSDKMDRPVIDSTGLTGSYDLKLDWIPESANSNKTDLAEATLGPALPDAIREQLGLKLERRKAPIGMVIVDRVEKVPTAN